MRRAWGLAGAVLLLGAAHAHASELEFGSDTIQWLTKGADLVLVVDRAEPAPEATSEQYQCYRFGWRDVLLGSPPAPTVLACSSRALSHGFDLGAAGAVVFLRSGLYQHEPPIGGAGGETAFVINGGASGLLPATPALVRGVGRFLQARLDEGALLAWAVENTSTGDASEPILRWSGALLLAERSEIPEARQQLGSFLGSAQATHGVRRTLVTLEIQRGTAEGPAWLANLAAQPGLEPGAQTDVLTALAQHENGRAAVRQLAESRGRGSVTAERVLVANAAATSMALLEGGEANALIGAEWDAIRLQVVGQALTPGGANLALARLASLEIDAAGNVLGAVAIDGRLAMDVRRNAVSLLATSSIASRENILQRTARRLKEGPLKQLVDEFLRELGRNR